MPTVIKVCKNCGKQYEACHTAKRVTTGFRWQDVACSPECGAAYLRAIQISRGIIPADEEPKKDAKQEQVKDIACASKADVQENGQAAIKAADAPKKTQRTRKKYNENRDTSEE